MGVVLPPERQPAETEVEWIERLQCYHPAHMPADAWKILQDHQTKQLSESPWVSVRVRTLLKAQLASEYLPPQPPPYAVPREMETPSDSVR